jgi:LmeA-like phospholipid-binding
VGRIIVALFVIAVVFLVADEGARRYEQSRVAHSIQDSLQLRRPPQVTLRGFPFLVALFRGHISSASISSPEVTAGSIRFSAVHLELHDLSFSAPQLFGGNLEAIHAARGSGSASVTSASLSSYLRDRGAPVAVAIQGERIVARVGPLSAAIQADLSISDNHLRVSAGSLPAVSVPLPDIVPGLLYGSVQVADSELRLTWRLHHPSLDLSH